MKTKRLTKEETTKKWMNYLQDLKNYLSYYDSINLTILTDKHKVGHELPRFLKNTNILIIDEYGFYRWNEKIPITTKIIDSYRKSSSINNKKYSINRKRINKNGALFNQSLNKDQIEKPTKIRKPKRTKEVQVKQVGLIRKFLRWIY